MGYRRLALTLIALLAAGAETNVAIGDLPPFVNFSEPRPPSEEDWLQFARRRQACCVQCGCCIEPALWMRSIYYYPCAEAKPCEPLHRSFKGCYGVRHPMPYYIPAESPPCLSLSECLCSRCAASRQSPKDRQASRSLTELTSKSSP